jgi:hypothetical protein
MSYAVRPKKLLSIRVNRDFRGEAKETAEHHSVLRAETELRSIKHVIQYNTTG